MKPYEALEMTIVQSISKSYLDTLLSQKKNINAHRIDESSTSPYSFL